LFKNEAGVKRRSNLAAKCHQRTRKPQETAAQFSQLVGAVAGTFDLVKTRRDLISQD
jgi:hypothetical protein